MHRNIHVSLSIDWTFAIATVIILVPYHVIMHNKIIYLLYGCSIVLFQYICQIFPHSHPFIFISYFIPLSSLTGPGGDHVKSIIALGMERKIYSLNISNLTSGEYTLIVRPILDGCEFYPFNHKMTYSFKVKN